MRLLIRIAGVLIALVLALAVTIRALFGSGQRLEDRTSAPVLPASALEVVVNLDYPPGNIAVSKTGRVFFTLHPDGRPPAKVLELVDGKPVPYPNEAFQHPASGAPHFRSILSLRIDQQDRLWTLDYADYGQGQPRLLAFDLSTDRLVHQYDFPSDIAGFLSMLNDLQIDPAGKKIYIAEASPIKQTPALIVYDIVKKTSRRLLQGHPSVAAGPFITQAPGRDMIVYGLYALRIGIDSIALDKRGEWLYYGSVNGDRLYRIATRNLNDETLTPAALAARVQDFAAKTLSDGLTMDLADNVFLSDMEHSAILTLGPDHKLTTLLKDPRLRWPDGFSFAPEGWLYVTCSSLQHVLFVSTAHMRAHAPYQIFRFKPGTAGVPGQ
jgi:sugar lactone lactonase YvrE